MIELLIFPVPSVASSYNLWLKKEEYKTELDQAKVNVSEWSLPKKVVFLGLPIAIIILTFLMPLWQTTRVIQGSTDFWFDASGIMKFFGVVAILLMASGRALSFFSVLKIRKNNQQQGDSFDLKINSIYRRSRNPIQLGMYVFASGLIVLYPNPIFIGGVFFYIFYMDYKIKIEEKFLIEKFGNPYLEYFSKTKRYV